MVRFPDAPVFAGFNRPMRFEGDLYDVEVVQGEVPRQLDGTFYRVQLDPQYPAKAGDDMPFNWDGMVTSFRFEDGHVDFRSRYVRTPRFVAERAARRALFGSYRNPFTDDPSVAGMVRGLANTNVYFHGGRLLAAKEDSPPIELDPETLDTIGPFDWGGALTSVTATAHPKVDPVTGELVFFGYAATGEATPDVAYYEADATGKVVHEAWFQVPYPAMIHDFAVSEHFVVFPIIPLVMDLDRLRAGGAAFAWDPEREIYLGVLPRKGAGDEVVWHRASNRFASHIMNAFDDGRHVHVDTPVGRTSAFPFFPDLSGKPFDPLATSAYLSRWTVDTEGAPGIGERRLLEAPGEFPRMDDRFATRPYRFGAMALTDVPGDSRFGPPTGAYRIVAAVDPESGRVDAYSPGPRSTPQEPCFVPRAPDAPEGDGYLLVVVGRLDEVRSDLVVLDARDVAAGPLATVALPFRLRYGLHGNWVDRAVLDGRSRSGAAPGTGGGGR
jgi:carotenoid cleavage dioxygenase